MYLLLGNFYYLYVIFISNNYHICKKMSSLFCDSAGEKKITGAWFDKLTNHGSTGSQTMVLQVVPEPVEGLND